MPGRNPFEGGFVPQVQGGRAVLGPLFAANQPEHRKISQAAIDCAGTTVVIGGDTFAKSFRELGGRSVYYAEE